MTTASDLQTLMTDAFNAASDMMAAARQINRRDLASLPVLTPVVFDTPTEFTIPTGVSVYFPDFITLVVFDADGSEVFGCEGAGMSIRGIPNVYFRKVDLG